MTQHDNIQIVRHIFPISIRSSGKATTSRPAGPSRSAELAICKGPPRRQGRPTMPVYEYYCENCRRTVAVTLSIGEHDKGVPACPQCNGKDIRPLVSTFFSSRPLRGSGQPREQRRGELLSWLAHFIEGHPVLHRTSLAVWKHFPPRLAGFLRNLLTTHWAVGTVAVILDETANPPEVLLVQHSFRTKGAWGLPGGSLESGLRNPLEPSKEEARDDIIESSLRREVFEELGIEIDIVRLMKIDAVPYVPEEPGPYRLDRSETDCAGPGHPIEGIRPLFFRRPDSVPAARGG